MIRKLTATVLALALIGVQAPAFATEQAAVTDGKTETMKGYVVIQEGENAPELKQVDVTVIRDGVMAGHKQFATVDLARELDLDKRPPALLRQMGLLVDQAVEAEDVSTLVSLSLALAAFEKTAGKQAASLNSKDLLRLAGQLATQVQDKAGMALVAQAYQDAAFGLADKDRAEEFAQLAENTRDWEDVVVIGAGVLAGVWAWLYSSSTAAVSVDNYSNYGLDIYVDDEKLGYVSGNSDKSFRTGACGRDVTLYAKDTYGKILKQRTLYLSCGKGVKWGLGLR